MRALRNLNPRYQADSWLPAGTTLTATDQMVGLYNRWCVAGPRADLARTLALSDPDRAIVRTGPGAPATALASGRTLANDDIATAAAPAPAKPKRAREHRVRRGETLTAIAQKFQCDTGDLAKANKIKGPRFAIRPGQKLRLEGCAQ